MLTNSQTKRFLQDCIKPWNC